MTSRAMWPLVGFLVLFGVAPMHPLGAMSEPQSQADEYFLQVHAMANDVWDAIGGIGDDVIEVRIEDATTGFNYGTCTLNFSMSPGGCGLHVDPNSTVKATLNEATLPPGVGVVRNPVFYIVPAEKTKIDDIFLELTLMTEGDAVTSLADRPATAETDAAWAAWLDVAERLVDGLRP
jgi:hypothetical protein